MVNEFLSFAALVGAVAQVQNREPVAWDRTGTQQTAFLYWYDHYRNKVKSNNFANDIDEVTHNVTVHIQQDMALKLDFKGKSVRFSHGQKSYPAWRFDTGRLRNKTWSVHEVEDAQKRMYQEVHIDAASGEKIIVVPAQQVEMFNQGRPYNSLAIMSIMLADQTAKKNVTDRYAYLEIPKISASVPNDEIPWLKYFQMCKKDSVHAFAVRQECKFSLQKAQGAEEPTLDDNAIGFKIHKPFYVMVTADDVPQIVSRCDTSTWK